jgi:hypothetical protein
MLNFDTIRAAWDKLRTERETELQKLAPNLSNPGEIYLKKIREDDNYIILQFNGFSNAVDQTQAIPQVKRMIVEWIRKYSMEVQIMPGDLTTLMVRVSKETKFSEAAISIFKRDPKTNKAKKAYRCVGGKKDGRRVSNPDQCIGVPDFNKKMNFAISKRTKYGQATKSKTKTKLTNIISKRVRKANQRLKKARGF